MIERLKWWWFRKRTGYVCSDEVTYLLQTFPQCNWRGTQASGVIKTYACSNNSLSHTAKMCGVSCERVRQMLIKFKRKCDVARNV